jgi:hypothetical protein
MVMFDGCFDIWKDNSVLQCGEIYASNLILALVSQYIKNNVKYLRYTSLEFPYLWGVA